MKISPSTAINIVTEMKKIIGEDLTFMDTSCHIIACTDPQRIGDYHAATEKMLKEGLSEMSVPDDNTYEGTKSGVNLTLELDGSIVGVVGITGKEEEVIRYGQVVKRMTEILLMESSLKDQKYNERQVRNRFLQEWLITSPLEMSESLVNEAQRLGISMDIPRRLILLEREPGSIMDDEEIAKADHRIRSILREDSRNLSGSTGGSYIVLLTERSDKKIKSLVEHIQSVVKKECGHRLIAGIDNHNIVNAQLKEAYTRTKRALRAAANGAGLVFYDDILLEIISNEISDGTKKDFLSHLFHNITEDKLKDEMNLLRAFYSTNGSITETASRLHCHKNTVQYRMNRIFELTGYDPRKISETSYFYLALNFYQELYD